MSKQTKIILFSVIGLGAAVAAFSGFCCLGFWSLTKDYQPTPLGYTALTHEQFYKAVIGKSAKHVKEQFGEPVRTENPTWCEGTDCIDWHYQRLTTSMSQPIDYESISLDSDIEIRFVDGIVKHVWFNGTHYR